MPCVHRDQKPSGTLGDEGKTGLHVETRVHMSGLQVILTLSTAPGHLPWKQNPQTSGP